MKNRLNDLDSKSYMKFLKSWFIYNDNSYLDFIKFFSKEKVDFQKSNIGIWGLSKSQADQIIQNGRIFSNLEHTDPNILHYSILDISGIEFTDVETLNIFYTTQLEPLLKNIKSVLVEKGYLTIFAKNFQTEAAFFPAAWQIGKMVAAFFEMKDEKIGCTDSFKNSNRYFPTCGEQVVYALNFRNTYKDQTKTPLQIYRKTLKYQENLLAKWFILKPPQRKENVKLHPAKFPEVLISEFIKSYTQPEESVFDPMSGTGSTQIAALENQRRAYGTEITDHFYQIALKRINSLNPEKEYYMACEDAYNLDKIMQFPEVFDYIVTSPPYWDMLNMKGAETQKKRSEKGLYINYSELDTDLGNCADYDIFISKLLKIYKKILNRLKTNGYITIIIKNIKKKGTIYTFAWDLVEHLSREMKLVNVQFWLQDDIRIAPYGYGNAWVSNTFHHYCLTFQK